MTMSSRSNRSRRVTIHGVRYVIVAGGGGVGGSIEVGTYLSNLSFFSSQRCECDLSGQVDSSILLYVHWISYHNNYDHTVSYVISTIATKI